MCALTSSRLDDFFRCSYLYTEMITIYIYIYIFFLGGGGKLGISTPKIPLIDERWAGRGLTQRPSARQTDADPIELRGWRFQHVCIFPMNRSLVNFSSLCRII